MHDAAAGTTDLLLAAVLLGCAAVLLRTPGVRRSWPLTFASFGVAALAGTVYHLAFPGSTGGWLVSAVLVALAISALLAASAGEVAGGRVARALTVLRLAGLGAYVLSVVLGGGGGTAALVLCESVTMLAVVALWAYAARAGHPAAVRVLVAIAVCAAPAAFFAVPAATLTAATGLDAASLQHLGQLPGVLLLCAAALACAPRPVSA